jgi:iron-sulfur cluster assembly accessory protein
MATEVLTKREPVICLTRSAAEHIRSMLAEQPDNAGKHLRVYVEGGGCAGMQYGMVFDEQRAEDLVVEFFGVTVLVDAMSADHLQGAVIDYVDALTGGGFKITNPQAQSTCGCGKSFEA